MQPLSEHTHTMMDVDPESDFRVKFHAPQLAPMHIPGWDYSSVPELVDIPSCVPDEDALALTELFRSLQSATTPDDIERHLRALALIWEDYYLPKFPVPFFQVRVADVRAAGGSLSTALPLYDEVLHGITGQNGAAFAQFVSTVRMLAQGDTEQQARSTGSLTFFQRWKPAREHANPFNWPMLPPASADILAAWRTSPYQRQYLNYIWIKAHHLEGTFHLVGESADALTHWGFAPHLVRCDARSDLKDPEAIVQALIDLEDAFSATIPCHERPELLTPGLIQAVHAKLMRTSKVKINDPISGGVHYINAGFTRQTTQKSVVRRSQQYNLAFCPAERVDQQLEYICRMGKQYIARWRNPFATAAWLHVTFVRCHPFDDGNGRMSLLISSIPLMRHGFPPLCITPSLRSVYYDALNIAWEGDFQPLINCFVDSMNTSLEEVQRIMGAV